MDFEKYAYSGSIPPGLTKTIVNEWGHSSEAERAGRYYWGRNTDPKVEIRVLEFAEEKSE
jgi:hypothetical protein